MPERREAIREEYTSDLCPVPTPVTTRSTYKWQAALLGLAGLLVIALLPRADAKLKKPKLQLCG